EPTDTVPDAMMASLFEKHLAKIEAWMAAQSNMSVLYLPYHEVAEQPEKHVDEIISFLGLPLDRQKMLEAVDPSLYRNRA
ncbi:MAG: sulfotransferase domain-containing protein, partial [Chloroflexota bacterium]